MTWPNAQLASNAGTRDLRPSKQTKNHKQAAKLVPTRLDSTGGDPSARVCGLCSNNANNFCAKPNWSTVDVVGQQQRHKQTRKLLLLRLLFLGPRGAQTTSHSRPTSCVSGTTASWLVAVASHNSNQRCLCLNICLLTTATNEPVCMPVRVGLAGQLGDSRDSTEAVGQLSPQLAASSSARRLGLSRRLQYATCYFTRRKLDTQPVCR